MSYSLGIARVRVTAQAIYHFLAAIVSVDTVDDEIAKFHFEGLSIADSTGRRCHQRTVEGDVIVSRQRNATAGAE